MTDKKVQLELTLDQAKVVANALDFYSRIGIGQLEEVPRVLQRQFGFVNKLYNNEDQPINWKLVESDIRLVKIDLGLEPNGSLGISNDKVSASARRAYEVYKVLTRAIAMDNNPNPNFYSVDYDGLSLRYTQDQQPKAEVINDGT